MMASRERDDHLGTCAEGVQPAGDLVGAPVEVDVSVVIAADIMDEDFPRVARTQGMNEALRKFSEAKSERLPVVDNLHSKQLVGSISKTDIILHLAGDQGEGG